MSWDDSWTPPSLASAARAIDAPPALEAPTLEVATPCPRVRAIEPEAGDAWLRRLERWREVRAALDALPAASWPRTAPAWGWDAGDPRAPVELGASSAGAKAGAWAPLARGVRGAIAAARPRRVVVRGARRAGKSSNVCEAAVADATSGTWSVGAGDVGLPDRLVSLARLDKRAQPS